MKWAQISGKAPGLPENFGDSTEPRAICFIGEEIFGFAQTLDSLISSNDLTSLGTQDQIRELRGVPLKLQWENLEFLAPLTSPSKVLCIGLNFTDHAQEVGAEIPAYPTVFTKFSNALIGPNDDIHLPPESTKIDWEAELCMVVGQKISRGSEEQAAQAILGYTVLNDISVRDWQGRTSEWFQGKNWDKTTPFGPCIVTPDAANFGNDLSIRCLVDGETRQEGNSANMIFSPAHILSYISTFMTLEPGDLVALGTPAGVGLSLHPRQWLKDGQIVETSIQSIGTLRNRCVLAT